MNSLGRRKGHLSAFNTKCLYNTFTVFGFLSDMYGRKFAFQIANVSYIIIRWIAFMSIWLKYVFTQSYSLSSLSLLWTHGNSYNCWKWILSIWSQSRVRKSKELSSENHLLHYPLVLFLILLKWPLSHIQELDRSSKFCIVWT